MLLLFSSELFCQIEKHGQLLLTYEPQSDSLYGKDSYSICLYFLDSCNNYYLVYKIVNYLENFEYISRFGPNNDEYFVFSSTSSPADESRLLYWRTNSNELFSCDLVGEFLLPIETSFNPETLFVNCISTDSSDCGAVHQQPVVLEKKITKKDLIGNELPSSLKVIRKWKF